jgi:hypothetical protein
MDDIQLSKNIELNSKSLMKNLEIAVGKLKGGAKIEDALTKVDISWYNMAAGEREKYRELLVPKPTKEYDKELDRIMKEYGKKK